jgi:hypothetical protein
MSWFKKKRTEDFAIQPPISSRVEVEIDKNASREAAEKAKKANEHLNTLLVENGFTLKIYLAAGHSSPKKRNQ